MYLGLYFTYNFQTNSPNSFFFVFVIVNKRYKENEIKIDIFTKKNGATKIEV